MLKAIETIYRGVRFRSRLEARWAVFFDACGIEWEYEPEGYDLGDGVWYLPDFRLHGVAGRGGSVLYVEVKGEMTDKDREKINRFSQEAPILVVGNIPVGEDIDEITDYISERGYSFPAGGPYEFNFETIDGDYFVAHPGVNLDGKFELFGDDCTYLSNRDDKKTERAYFLARNARFERRADNA